MRFPKPKLSSIGRSSTPPPRRPWRRADKPTKAARRSNRPAARAHPRARELWPDRCSRRRRSALGRQFGITFVSNTINPSFKDNNSVMCEMATNGVMCDHVSLFAALVLASAVTLLSCGKASVDDSRQESFSAKSKMTWSVVLPWGVPTPASKLTPEGYPTEIIHVKTGIEMIFIPSGSFAMGDNRRPWSPVHTVSLSAFYIAKHETTNQVYRRWDPLHNSGEIRGISLNDDNQLVVLVSWEDATKFCSENDLRLPTEAEWEYSARGNTTTVFPWGDDLCGRMYANLGAMDSDELVPLGVGSYSPNAFGLCDVIGGVWEWCSDFFADDYYRRGDARINPRGPDIGTSRVMRGGSWQGGAYGVASRACFGQKNVLYSLGFRAARDV